MKLIAGPASQKIGKQIATELDLQLLKLHFKHFYDKETYLRIEGDVNKEEILLVQSTFEPQEKHLLELMLIASSLKENGADRINAIIPYLCYARADKENIKGEILAHQRTLQFLENSGVDSVITVNVHNREAFISSKNNLEKYDIICLDYSIKQLAQKYKKNWFIISPDEGRIKEAEQVANILNCSYNYLKKHRDAKTNLVSFQKPQFSVHEKDVLVIDDIISSGGTALKAAKIILENQPKSLLMFFIHSLAKPEVYEKLEEIGVDKIFTTNTIPNDYIEQVDISLVISDFIKDKFL